MKAEWMSDARKIPGEVMNFIRRIAVRAIEEKHYSPKLVSELLGIDRTSIYDWLRNYRHQGEQALDTGKAPGGDWVITSDIDQWLKDTILNSTPADHGYDTVLWTLNIIVDLLKEKFNLWVSDSTVAIHLHRLDLSCQHPCYRAFGQDPVKVDRYLNKEFPEIQRLAKELKADIVFEDESSVRINTRSGRTWGLVGSPPRVRVSDDRSGYHMLSMVSAAGELIYRVERRTINSAVYIDFLKMALANRPHPLIVIADHASYHDSKVVRKFAEANRDKIRLFFLPAHSPEMNPDEQVWNEIKHRGVEKKPIKNKSDLEYRLYGGLEKLKKNVEKVCSFFKLKNTKYAGLDECTA